MGYAQAPTENRNIWESWVRMSKPTPAAQAQQRSSAGKAGTGKAELLGWMSYWLGAKLDN